MNNEVLETENEVFDIEKVNVNTLPELHGLKEKQLQIVRDNPFVEISDNKSYESAKKSRTALVSARTSIENQDKLIASKLKKFREGVAAVSAELIAITKPHEEKQQSEVRRYEDIKEQERLEKARLEEERKSKIKASIDETIKAATEKINNLTFELIDTLKVDFEENLYKTDTTPFEEFELDFNEKLIQVKNLLSSKIQQLELAENQRLENIRLQEEAAKLAAEREKLEADKKAEEQRLAEIKEKQEAELKAKELEAQKVRDEESARLQKERENIEAEKARLAKIEEDRIAKDEADQKAKADAERLEALKPDKEKAIDYLESKKIRTDAEPSVLDQNLQNEIHNSIIKINEFISGEIQIIKNYK